MSLNLKGQLNFQCLGDTAKPAVLFLHGFLGTASDWQSIIDIIQEDFHCISIDLPGHGKSNKVDNLSNIWSFDALTSILDNILDYLSIKKASLVGYSMGGRIAQHFALGYAAKVNKLVLESCSFGIKDKEERTSRMKADKMLAERLKTEPFTEFLDSWYDQALFYGIKNNKQYQEMITRRLKNDPMLLSQALAAFSVANQIYLQERLFGFKKPLMYICGSKDEKYLTIAKSFKQTKPESKLFVMENCGHNTHFEEPDLFAEHLAEFLSL